MDRWLDSNRARYDDDLMQETWICLAAATAAVLLAWTMPIHSAPPTRTGSATSLPLFDPVRPIAIAISACRYERFQRLDVLVGEG